MSKPATTTPGISPMPGVKRPPGPRTLSPLSNAAALDEIGGYPIPAKSAIFLSAYCTQHFGNVSHDTGTPVQVSLRQDDLTLALPTHQQSAEEHRSRV